jgi:hypothetical protein
MPQLRNRITDRSPSAPGPRSFLAGLSPHPARLFQADPGSGQGPVPFRRVAGSLVELPLPGSGQRSSPPALSHFAPGSALARRPASPGQAGPGPDSDRSPCTFMRHGGTPVHESHVM